MSRILSFMLTTCCLLVGAVGADRVQLEGRLECLGPSGLVPLSNPCPQGSELIFRSLTGRGYRFNPEDPRAAIFEDERVRNQALQLTAEVNEAGALSLLSVSIRRDDRLFQPHYFCSVCNITAFAPGPCWCCQAEFEYREKELSEPLLTQDTRP